MISVTNPKPPSRHSSFAQQSSDSWYARNNCTHCHCPEGCTKAQPAMMEDGEMYCMKCAVLYHRITKMVPCTPAICDDA